VTEPRLELGEKTLVVSARLPDERAALSGTALDRGSVQDLESAGFTAH
jgi:hypothetical protein